MLGAQLLSAADLALSKGMQAVAEGPDPTNRYAHFIPDAIQTDPEFRKAFESVATDDFVQVMRDTVDSLFDGQLRNPWNDGAVAQGSPDTVSRHARKRRHTSPRQGGDCTSPRPRLSVG